jgi:hypothetical protein
MRLEGDGDMRRLVLGLIAIAVFLLAATTLTGCGDKTASGGSSAILSGLQPFVAGAMLKQTTDGTETTVDGVTQDRNWKYQFQVEASDPRVSGDLEVIFNADATPSGSYGKYWGTSVLSNSKGTWVCEGWNGALTTSPMHQFTFVASKGTGAYAGLELYIQWHMVENSPELLPPSAPGGTAVSGWIQKVQ